MSDPILILLNAPPRSGKDLAATALQATLGQATAILRFTKPVKDATHLRYGIVCSHDAFEAVKDTPLDLFGGLSPRAAYVEMGRRMREAEGEDAIALRFARKITAAAEPIVICPDVGSNIEASIAADTVGRDNVLLFRIHSRGVAFNDERSWVQIDGVESHDVGRAGLPASEVSERVCDIALRFVRRRVGSPDSAPAGLSLAP